jgi:lipopolysaccharide export system protein LptC
MASLNYTHNVRQNTLSRELPARIHEVHQIHKVNYGLIVSSLIITLALVALAWLVTVSTSHIQQINPENDIAQSYAYAGPVSAHGFMHQ